VIGHRCLHGGGAVLGSKPGLAPARRTASTEGLAASATTSTAATSTSAEAGNAIRNHFRLMHRTTPAHGAVTLIAVAAALLAGCGSGSDTGSARHRIGVRQQGVGPQVQPHHAKRHHAPAAKPKPAPRPDHASLCPPRSRTLAGVYQPNRLRVLDPCRRVTGTVEATIAEDDGDVHLGIDLDTPYRGMLMPGNRTEQSGNLVVELMPRDHGHLTQPSTGDRLVIVGAYVDDTNHSWAEIHPVFGLARNGGPLERSGPRYGGSPASASAETALATCRTSTRRRCVGYGGVTAPPHRAAKPSSKPAGGKCDPNYAGACIDPNASDYDCAGAGGDGPLYVGRVRVVGTDHYGLDSDHDGIGCE
jgi:hypothetical protein